MAKKVTDEPPDVRQWPSEQDPLLLEEQEVAGEKAKYNAVLLCSMMALLYAEQNLLAPNLTAIAEDLGSKLGGEFALGLFILGAPFALLAS